jgi:hypothetical protein
VQALTCSDLRRRRRSKNYSHDDERVDANDRTHEEDMKTLVEVGQGLLPRIYHAAWRLKSSEDACFSYLSDPATTKLRKLMFKYIHF